ncbi:MAG TPA: 3-deoxy-8-phosphooctulonate synthase [Chlamydiales bacterium]|nr:3-deoxy-8-phosphooctulonate synthase [Chlamydiales bacterium]
MKNLSFPNFEIGMDAPLAVICGPCVIESEEHTLYCAKILKEIFSSLPFSFIFKASYDKANRSSSASFRGPGLEKGLAILQKVKQTFALPVTTDIHSPEEALEAGRVCEMIQIPAFLCRQTDLLFAAAKTNAVINIKKGQFLSPWEMKNVIEKLQSCGKEQILLTERGASFGYNNLISDMRSIPIMQNLGFPVCFDATHSVQLPGGLGTLTGGQREFVPTLARSAVAAGCNAIFLEAHPNPDLAKSDASSVYPFADLTPLLHQLARIYEAVYPK